MFWRTLLCTNFLLFSQTSLACTPPVLPEERGRNWSVFLDFRTYQQNLPFEDWPDEASQDELARREEHWIRRMAEFVRSARTDAPAPIVEIAKPLDFQVRRYDPPAHWGSFARSREEKAAALAAWRRQPVGDYKFDVLETLAGPRRSHVVVGSRAFDQEYATRPDGQAEGLYRDAGCSKWLKFRMDHYYLLQSNAEGMVFRIDAFDAPAAMRLFGPVIPSPKR